MNTPERFKMAYALSAAEVSAAQHCSGLLIYIFVHLTTDLRFISCDLSDYVMKHRVCICRFLLNNTSLK